jgi:acetoin utilization protein AcuC
MDCRVGVVEGEELLSYSFPSPHPFTAERARVFWQELDRKGVQRVRLRPQKASEEMLELFHSKEHIRFVKMASHLGYGYLDQGDTPAFPGIFEAAQYVVGSTLHSAESVLTGNIDHSFNPVGGLHHARRGLSAGFCVFNDVGVLFEALRKKGISRILYVDIDVHHGDGVYYEYEGDKDVFIFDIHEDGRYIYPGTGRDDEVGSGDAVGTKVNVPLQPGSDDEDVEEMLVRMEEHARRSRPEFIVLQAGADGLEGDPLASLRYTERTHARVSSMLHSLAHELCEGRIVSLGGGGYLPENCARAWTAVVSSLTGR